MPPGHILRSFAERFGESINTEWFIEDEIYEAVFYLAEIEHIARFNAFGELLDTKTNLPLHLIKPPHAAEAAKVGELMNLIEINRNGQLFYELIARDKALIRYYLYLDEAGNLLEKRKL